MLHCPEPTKERIEPTTISIPAIEIPHLTRFTQARRQDFAAGGAKSHKGGHIFEIQYWTYVATGGKT